MRNRKVLAAVVVITFFVAVSCSVPLQMSPRKENKSMPETYRGLTDTLNTAKIKTWRDFFHDQNLKALIDTALKRNQELNIMVQENYIAQNEAKARKGEYLPFVGVGASAGLERVSKYTSQGASDDMANLDNPLQNYMIGVAASWEIDIWKKLRNRKKAATLRYLASVEGRNLMITNLIADIAGSYYELMALDNELEILVDNIEIQQAALTIVQLEKTATRVTELAVRRFEAEVLKNQALQYYIKQRIIEKENEINFLVGRFPQPIRRDSKSFTRIDLNVISAGIPSQLLANRPDIRAAELKLAATKIDVKAAKANFYPTLNISLGAGYQAFNTAHFISSPQSLIYGFAGSLVAPLINRNTIKAAYWSANAKQVQAVYDYERTILNAHIEVANQLNLMDNLGKSYEMKSKQMEALTKSIDVSIILFKSARADYMEVLLTQRDALQSRFELVETRIQQLNAMVNIYRSLGGGWR